MADALVVALLKWRFIAATSLIVSGEIISMRSWDHTALIHDTAGPVNYYSSLATQAYGVPLPIAV